MGTPAKKTIMPYLQSGDTISNIVKRFSEDLRYETLDLSSILHSNKLLEFHGMITDSIFLSNIKHHFDAIYDICKDLGILFSIDGRRKTLKSIENKINLLLLGNCSLDLLRDIFAFRIVVFDTKDPAIAVKKCYTAMEKIILYLSTQGFIPCESVITKEERKFNKELYKDIYVPEKEILNPQYEDFVKDYIFHPKANGYQSLHSSFRDSHTGRFFEVQIRTSSMHIWAKYHTADHSIYKRQKYASTDEQWDLSKINVEGFYFISSEDGKALYEDFIGLIDPLIIFSRRHSF